MSTSPAVWVPPRPGEIREVFNVTDPVCIHGIDLQVRCEHCTLSPGLRRGRRESWAHYRRRMLSTLRDRPR